MSHRPPSFAVMLVALAIVFALAWMFFLRSGPAAPASGIKGIQGTYTWRAAGTSVGQTGTFSAVAGGNAGGEAKSTVVVLGGGPPAAAYDAATRTETVRVSHGPVVTEVRTVDAWPPIWRVATHSPLDYQGLAAIVRTAVEDGDDAVGIKPLKDGDRTVWRAAMTIDGKQIDIVVDQETGIVTWYSDGESTFTADVDWDSPPPADVTYSVDVPAGTEVKTTADEAHTYAPSAAAAGAAAGYDALVSDLAPDGYRLKAVATTRDDLRPLSWFSNTMISVPVASAGTAVLELYTRGLSQVTVEQVGPATMDFWATVSGGEGDPAPDKLSYQETTLQYGALKGATASTWYQESGPSLYASDERRAVFITGALTRQELIAFAEGVKPVPASTSR